MNGLLHRLAARAAGSAVLLRSNARLPYRGGLLNWTTTSESERVTPPAAVPRTTHDSEVPVPEPIRCDPLQRADLPITVVAASLREARASRQTDDIVRQPVNPPVAPRSPLAAGPSTATTPRTSSLEVHAPISAQDAPTARERLAVPVQPPIIVSLETANGAIPPTPAPLLPRTIDCTAPAPMPPPVIAQTIYPALASPADRQQQVKTAADETTEVHIHIGRIDVTAVHEAPPRRCKPPPQQAPMSLDAYLARRNRA
jgi:hypothetical protein